MSRTTWTSSGAPPPLIRRAHSLKSGAQGVAAAFTLVEILVVLGIIALLAGILLPAVLRSRQRAHRANCQNNQSQIARALAAYLNDNAEYYPSYVNYGGLTATGANTPAVAQAGSRVIREYSNFNNYPITSPRHMALAYASGNLASFYTPGLRNFIPNGLGLLVASGFFQDGAALSCPVLASPAVTWYGQGTGSVLYGYTHYGAALWSRLGQATPSKAILYGDGRWLPVFGTDRCLALLGGYSYRLTPYFRGVSGWSDNSTLRPYALLPYAKPAIRAYKMCPPFKTIRQLGQRAVVSDTFDRAATWQGPSMVRMHHGEGYNVLYGDGHAEWRFDPDDEMTTGIYIPSARYDNLTSSSPTSQEAWHIFDMANRVDE